MKYPWLLTLLALFLLQPAAAQNRDLCASADALMAVGLSLDGPTTLYRIAGAELDSVGSLAGAINALAYSGGRAYASRLGTDRVLEIGDRDGALTVTDSFDVVGMPAIDYAAGAADPNTSTYYAFARNYRKVRRVPLADRGAAYDNVAAPLRLDWADFVYLDGALVGYEQRNGALSRLDLDTGDLTYVAAPDLPVDLYPAAYTAGGSLFLYLDDDKKTYEVDPATGDVLGTFDTGLEEPTRQIDAATCPAPSASCAPILELQADVETDVTEPVVKDDLLVDLDVALYHCRRKEYVLTADALADFIIGVNAASVTAISLADKLALATAAQAIIDGLPHARKRGGRALGIGRDQVAGVDAMAAEVAVSAEPVVFPNPARANVSVRAAGPFGARFYDLMGRLVLEAETASGTAEVDVAGLSPGLYVVRIDAADGVHTTKLTVAR